jgi:hypothetical protein
MEKQQANQGVELSVPQFHLLRPWKKASSRLTQAGWYTLGQPLQVEESKRKAKSGLLAAETPTHW